MDEVKEATFGFVIAFLGILLEDDSYHRDLIINGMAEVIASKSDWHDILMQLEHKVTEDKNVSSG